MNAVISLCHFCNTHGPKIIFSTQAFHAQELYVTEDEETQFRTDFLNQFLEKSGNKTINFQSPVHLTSEKNCCTTLSKGKTETCEVSSKKF